MPEIEKNTAGAGGNGEAGNSDDQNQNGAGENKGDQNSDGAGNGDENKDDKGDGSSDDAGDDKDKNDDGDDEEPVIRKRRDAKDFIIERQKRKIEKLKNSKSKDDEDDDDAGNKSDDEDDDGDIDPEDEKLISKVVAKKFAPIFKQQAEAEDEQEVKQFINDNPDFAKYEKKVKNFMKHPSRSQMPIKSIFYEVAGDDLMKIGAQRAKKAEDEANRNNAGGGSARGDDDGAKVDYSTMTAEEFEKKREEVRRTL